MLIMDEELLEEQSLQHALSAVLPQGFSCKAHHVSTPSKPCDPLFSPTLGNEPEKTRLATHFLAVSILPDEQDSARSGSGQDSRSEVLIVGLEVFVYKTKHLTTIFVGKADSTGYLTKRATQHSSPIKAICTAFLQWLSNQLRRQNPVRTLVISLFARAQAQYLFPGSSEHESKHILDDRQLVKWWAKVLDPIVSAKPVGKSTVRGYLTIPGYDAHELRMYLPRTASSQTSWKTGNPLKELGAVRGLSQDALPRSLLPRFPDDPKARYMSDLDEEVGMSDDTSVTASPVKNKTGKWKNIATIDRFWEAMEFRQECSSGRVVGFLWVVMSPPPVLDGAEDQVPGASQQSNAPGEVFDRSATITPAPKSSPHKRKRKPLTGPIISRQPRLKGGSSALSNTNSSELDAMVNSSGGTGVSLVKSAYDKAMHTLLHLDFCSLDIAVESTTKWTSEVCRLGGVTNCGIDVVGTCTSAPLSHLGATNGASQVLDMSTMVRKKRKVVDDVDRANVPSVPAVNVLNAGIVRKKAKPPAVA